MLVLSRKKKESIVIDGCITVTIIHVQGNTIRLGIEAPREVSVRRNELAPRQSEVAARGIAAR
jgi:carbon storage regulator